MALQFLSKRRHNVDGRITGRITVIQCAGEFHQTDGCGVSLFDRFT
jgi:hypothetical protein